MSLEDVSWSTKAFHELMTCLGIRYLHTLHISPECRLGYSGGMLPNGPATQVGSLQIMSSIDIYNLVDLLSKLAIHHLWFYYHCKILDMECYSQKVQRSSSVSFHNSEQWNN